MFDKFSNDIMIFTICIVVLKPFLAEVFVHKHSQVTANFALSVK